MDAIVTRGLSKTYRALGKRPKRSLDSLDLQVGEGEVFGFLGRNGAGKTTTIKMLCGLIKPSAGDAHLFGESIRERTARRLLGYLPEQPYFYEYLTPRETIDFYARLRGLGARDRQAQWETLADRLWLRDIANERIKGFSKGMRQRIGFAVALIGDPKLLILDEPMSGLDPVGRRNIRDLINQCRDEGKTIFFSSHVLADVELVCDRVGILVHGRLVQEGRLQALLGDEKPEVEIRVRNLKAQVATAIGADALAAREVCGEHVFRWQTENDANAALREILDAGGSVVECVRVRESLEDFFIRQDDAPPNDSDEGAAKDPAGDAVPVGAAK